MKFYSSESRSIKFLWVLVASAMVLPFVFGETLEVGVGFFPSISRAMHAAKPGDTIVVGNGIYKEHIMINAAITLKARSIYKAIIDASGNGCAVTLGGGATIIGFEIRHGTIGIKSQSPENAIIGCRITAMQQSGITCVGNSPKISDNIIVYNKGSGIQGWDLQSQETSAPSILHNTVAFNGNCGIALGGKSMLAIESNIIAFNARWGIKLSEGSGTVQITKNVFYENPAMSYIKAGDNLTLDPQFIDPRKMNFSLQPDSPCKNKGSQGVDSGARNN